MSLIVEKKPCWTVVCDHCGEGDNVGYGGSFHYHDEAEAREQLQGMDWIITKAGGALCLDCYEELRAKIPCPHGAGCNGGGCGCCPSDEQVVALALTEEQA